MPIQNRVEAIGETPDELKEWQAIAKFVARGKGSAVKDKGKKILGVTDKLPKSTPPVHEIVVLGTRYAIVKIVGFD